MNKCITGFILGTCLLLSTAVIQAKTIFADEFNNDTLDPRWNIKSVAGVDYLLTKQPGKLYVVNKASKTTIGGADSASLSIDAPNNNFVMETQITYVDGACGGESGPTLFITFDSRDTIAWSYSQGGVFGDKKHLFTNTQTGMGERVGAKEPPVFLRIRRVSDNYIFEIRESPDTAWEGIKQMIVKDKPVSLGLMFPNNACENLDQHYEAALGYFRLEDSAQQTSSTTQQTTPPSAHRALPVDYTNIPDKPELTITQGSGLIALSPSENIVATARSYSVSLWNTTTGALIRTLDRKNDGIESIAFAPDGKTLAIGHQNGTVELWNYETGRSRFPLQEGPVDVLTVSPDGSMLASVSGGKVLKIHDVKTGALLLTIQNRFNARHLAFSPDGNMLASSQANVLTLWAVKTGNSLKPFYKDDKEDITGIAFSADGQFIAAGDANGVHIWSVQSGELLRSLTGKNVSNISFSPTGKVLAVVNFSNKGTVAFWDADTGQQLRTVATEDVYYAAFSPDGHTIVMGNRHPTIWRVP